jgi:hypothetical protein
MGAQFVKAPNQDGGTTWLNVGQIIWFESAQDDPGKTKVVLRGAPPAVLALSSDEFRGLVCEPIIAPGQRLTDPVLVPTIPTRPEGA